MSLLLALIGSAPPVDTPEVRALLAPEPEDDAPIDDVLALYQVDAPAAPATDLQAWGLFAELVEEEGLPEDVAIALLEDSTEQLVAVLAELDAEVDAADDFVAVLLEDSTEHLVIAPGEADEIPESLDELAAAPAEDSTEHLGGAVAELEDETEAEDAGAPGRVEDVVAPVATDIPMALLESDPEDAAQELESPAHAPSVYEAVVRVITDWIVRARRRRVR